MKIITIANQKGGVAKTATTNSLAAFLVNQGYRVLAIDMDPQANLTSNFGIGQVDNDKNIYSVLTHSLPMTEAICKVSPCDIVPSTIRLAFIEPELQGAGRDHKLEETILNSKLGEKYDFVIIDTPPNLGIVTINALTACKYVIIPTMPDPNSVKGINQLNTTIETVRKYANTHIEVMGVLFTRFAPRTHISQDMDQLTSRLGAMLGFEVFNTHIRSSVVVPESNARAKDIFSYKPNSAVARDYEAFGLEFLRRVG